MTNFEFMEKAEEKVERCWSFLMNKYNINKLCPAVDFKLKGTRAGVATGCRLINLNMGFVAKDGEDMIEQTVPHEVAHCWLTAIGHPSHVRSNAGWSSISAFYGGRRERRNVHGPEFMRILEELGGRMERTHSYDVSGIQIKKQKTWAWKCPKCGKIFNVSTTIHNKMLRGQIRFHPACGRELGRLERVY